MKPSGIEFRAANEADIDSIVGLSMESSAFHEVIDFRLAVRNDAAKHVHVFYSKLFKDKNARFFIASVNNILIGYICVQIQERPPIHVERESGFIDGAFVKTDYRRKGVGSTLFQMALDWLNRHDVQSIRLTVSPRNPAGLSFWRELGFTELMVMMHRPTSIDV